MEEVIGVMIILFSFFLVNGNCCFTKSEMDVVLKLINNLRGEHCILVTDACSNILNVSSILKCISHTNVFSTFMSINYLARYLKVEFYPDFRTIIVLKIKSASMQFFVDEVLKDQKISFFKWVFIKDPFDVSPLYYDNIYIPYDCQFLMVQQDSFEGFIVTEWFQFKKRTKLLSRPYGVWSNGDMNITNVGFYERRMDFNGFIWRVRKPRRNPSKFPALGVHKLMIEDLKKALNFSIVYHFYNYTGTTDVLLSIWPFHASEYHPNILAPTLSLPLNMFIRDVGGHPEGIASSYIRPFTATVWLSIGIWIFVSSSALTIFFFCHHSEKRLNYWDYVFLPLDSFTNQGNVPSVTTSFRICCFVSRIGPAFTIPAYSAAIVSFLMVQSTFLPFTNLKEFVEDGTYRLTVLKSTFCERYFKKSHDDFLRVEVGRFWATDKQLGLSYRDAAKKICKYNRLTFVGYSTHILYEPSKCKIQMIPKPIFNSVYGIPIKMNSSYKIMLRKWLTRFRTSGVLNKLQKNLDRKAKPQDQEKWKAIGFVQTKSILVLIVIGILFSLIFLCFETMIKRYFSIRKREGRKVHI